MAKKASPPTGNGCDAKHRKHAQGDDLFLASQHFLYTGDREKDVAASWTGIQSNCFQKSLNKRPVKATGVKFVRTVGVAAIQVSVKTPGLQMPQIQECILLSHLLILSWFLDGSHSGKETPVLWTDHALSIGIQIGQPKKGCCWSRLNISHEQ